MTWNNLSYYNSISRKNEQLPLLRGVMLPLLKQV